MKDENEFIKIKEEMELPNGIRVEYYCTRDGKSFESLLEEVMKIAADSLMRKMF